MSKHGEWVVWFLAFWLVNKELPSKAAETSQIVTLIIGLFYYYMYVYIYTHSCMFIYIYILYIVNIICILYVVNI